MQQKLCRVELTFTLFALFVQIVKLAFDRVRIDFHFNLETAIDKLHGLADCEKRVSLAAPRTPGVGDRTEAVGGHQIRQSPFLF